MTNYERLTFELSGNRYAHLRRLVERYENGELSDEDFKQLKRFVLHSGSTSGVTAPGAFELLLASYSEAMRLNAALAALRGLRQDQRAGIVDAALASKALSTKIKVRSISELTRRPASGGSSIVAAVCGLLFAADALNAERGDRALAASFGAFATGAARSTELQAIGAGMRPGNTAIVVITWASSADSVALSVHGFDSFTRLLLSSSVSSKILGCLVEHGSQRGAAPDH